MRKLVFISLVSLFGCGSDDTGPQIPDDATIIAIGDSVMAWNEEEGASIPDVIGAELGRVVYNAAVPGAYFTGGGGEEGNIPDQYVEREWEWLVLDGGGNDVNDECSCTACADTIDDIISADGTSGALPDLVNGVVADGVRVVVFGYYNVPPTADYGFADCNSEVAELRDRLLQLAESTDDVWFVDGTEIFDPGDLEYYDDDHVHPSALGSELIGEAIAAQILSAEEQL